MDITQVTDAFKFIWDFFSDELFAWVLGFIRTLILS